jgi:hypothetical protein
VVRFTPPPSYPRGAILWYPLNRMLGGSHSPSDVAEKRQILCLPRIERRFLDSQARSAVAVTDWATPVSLNHTLLSFNLSSGSKGNMISEVGIATC